MNNVGGGSVKLFFSAGCFSRCDSWQLCWGVAPLAGPSSLSESILALFRIVLVAFAVLVIAFIILLCIYLHKYLHASYYHVAVLCAGGSSVWGGCSEWG